ncbi:MAG: HAD-IIIA family hydrolase [Ruminococcaceae bacterium]|nr:HAD-IIIA family hydrolase [Oscillospiraceae bacterium]
MKEAIILAGGLGTRLAKTVHDRQKVMAPVGCRPFLAYVLEYLRKHSYTKAVLAVSYHSEQIKEYFGDFFSGIEIAYSEEKEPLGTGGAIKQALSFCYENAVTVINGDTFFDVDIDKLYNIYNEKNARAVLAAKKMPDCTRHSTLGICDNGKIFSFREKKEQKEGYINGGVYVVGRDIFEEISKERFSFEKDILERMQDGLYAVKDEGYFIDMGVPEAYFRANTEIPLLFGENRFRAAFLDRDGVICKEKHHLYKCEDFEFIDSAPEAIETLREKGYLIIVITNQAGVAKGLYTEEDVKKLHEYMTGLLSDITHIDAIYYCPYHEDGTVEEYKKYSPDRKPSDGMIQKAVRDFWEKGIIIDLENSILIGDKKSDIEAGIKAGVGRNFLVKSGHKFDFDTDIADIVAESIREIAEMM